ncbi:MAG: hypothetical protein ACYC6F_17630, partial [Longimicrobiales bacterium]
SVVCGPLATALVRGQPVTSSISRKVRIEVKHYTQIFGQAAGPHLDTFLLEGSDVSAYLPGPFNG